MRKRLSILRTSANRSLGLSVTREVLLDAFGQKPLASALAPAGERGTSAFGAHARAETVLAFARSFRWLVSPFHKTGN